MGINAVAGNFADLIVKGTISIYGGETADQADGSVNMASKRSSYINFYSGVYRDAAGNLRAAQNLTPGQKVYQLQFYSPNITLCPLRWRYMYCNSSVAKDAIFTVDDYIWTSL